ncbi:MAG TPA: glyceraldehyde 3-phosphate dehydrogenase NAD-binding domain-containing protein [Gammaproteobacteria bacterium]|nr:glyceraldehyde 3-phosphate dehydrogenase NAD-binding domain-containing protein [Gammaproteobacteria bacterium]
MAKIAINGLGRIGGAVLKLAMDDPALEPVAVNDLNGPEQLAYQLRFDSVYGRYDKVVEARERALVIGDREIRVFGEKDPATLPWGDLAIDLAFECTGVFTDATGLEKHLQAGARKAALSAPSKSEGMPVVVPGVNHAGEANLFSCASCTTNCITPVMEILGRRIGVEKAIMSTTHALTGTQSVVDTANRKPERGRAGTLNTIPTSTGAAEATTKVLPDYRDRFDGVALRVPVAIGSIADITLVTARETTATEINDILREQAASERYLGVLGYTEGRLVSSDIIQDPRASVVELGLTQVVGGNLVKVLSWYDNEWGYAAQMVREAVRVTA